MKRNLHEGEEILHVQRMALLTRVPGLALGAVLTVVPFFFFFPFAVFGLVGLIPPLLVAAIGAYILARTALGWRRTYCTLTNQRILFQRHVGLAETRVQAAPLKKLSDVAYRKSGLLGTLLQIGSVRVLFQGVLPTMHLTNVKNPEQLHDIIAELASMQRSRATKSSRFERVHLSQEAS